MLRLCVYTVHVTLQTHTDTTHTHTCVYTCVHSFTTQKAVRFVFGRAFICSDMTSAQKVAFDRSVNAKAVTLDGEVFVSGTLTGGSVDDKPSILIQLSQYKIKLEEQTQLEHRTRDVCYSSLQICTSVLCSLVVLIVLCVN